ncbi:MAG: dihydrolipoyllysine-residue acetyltransferase [Bacteroidetes bacterium]|nr:dihydrolipoyllysine-residue acetyltransferase [Bacteroidota bacterium]
MLKEFTLPDLGDGIKKAVVLKVFVKPGDKIEEDAPVIEIESDKATIEVPSTVTGIVKEVRIKEGEEATHGMVLLLVETGEAAAVAPAPVAQVAETPAPKVAEVPVAVVSAPAVESVVEVTLPDLGDGIKSADILKVTVKVGDTVSVDQGILEVGSDKATIEIPSPVSGVVTELFVKEGDKATIGQVVLKIKSSVSAPAPVSVAKTEPVAPVVSAAVPAKPETPKTASVSSDIQPATKKNAAPAAPSVRRLAREIGVNVDEIPGTGPGGRLTQEDVKSWSKKLHQQKGSSVVSGGQAAGIAQKPLPDFAKFGSVERKPMSTIRYKTAEHLSYAWQTIPHVTQFDKADITSLEALRKQFSPALEKQGAKLTMTAILVKVLASALKKYPNFNSAVDMTTKEVIYKNYFHIGVAVDTEAGLMVPVIRDADKKNITKIALDLNDIATRARNRKITPDDLQGGCISITNLGGIGGTSFTPIVNSPEVAILGVSRGSMEPVWNGTAFEPKLMLPLSLSYDHRIIDGADAARFLRWVVEALEQPLKLLIEG